MFDLKQIVRPNILSLQPYRCARDDFKVGILLDANENTHGPAVVDVTSSEDALNLNRYPDPHQVDLKQQICDFRNAAPNPFKKGDGQLIPANLCLGVGSDESIDMLLRCVCTPGKDKLLTCPPTYGMYSICAQVNDVSIVKIPLTVPDFQVDTAAVISAVSDSSIKLIYLTSPGNPTSKLLAVSSIVELLTTLESSWAGLVVIDEAYIDFTDHSQSAATLVIQFPNLVVMQTLSKSFGLAGIRLGVTFCSEELSYYLNAMKYPYNISSLTSDLATRATSKAGLARMNEFVDSIKIQRAKVLKSLQSLPRVGENIGGLDANFLLLQILDNDGHPSNDVALELYNKLATENAVVVRFRGTELNCNGALRVSVGTAEENLILVEKFEKVLGELS